jgi:hypothetical protein
VTEAEWLACADPMPMLKYLRGRASDRQWRLFAVACGHAIRASFPTQAYHGVIVFAERFADGTGTKRQLDEKWRRVGSNSGVAMAVCGVADASASYAARKTVERTQGLGLSARSQAQLLRDIFGNPFRSVAIEPEWLTSTVVALAEGIYSEKAFDRMPILADALQDAGCDNTYILDHCRKPAEHVRGCWVIDLLLGKG